MLGSVLGLAGQDAERVPARWCGYEKLSLREPLLHRSRGLASPEILGVQADNEPQPLRKPRHRGIANQQQAVGVYRGGRHSAAIAEHEAPVIPGGIAIGVKQDRSESGEPACVAMGQVAIAPQQDPAYVVRSQSSRNGDFVKNVAPSSSRIAKRRR
ncbi:MAG TPA: hypothetical protein VG106_05030 [Vicinamibacterales bacterium]|nr:hypothetical protein [Vicinamibacterales bacterium]